MNNTMPKKGPTTHEVVIELTLRIAELKSLERLPTTRKGLSRLLKSEFGSVFSEQAVDTACKKLGVEYRNRKKPTGKVTGEAAAELCKTLRVLVQNIESECGMESGVLLKNGVGEALTQAIAKKSKPSSSLNPQQENESSCEESQHVPDSDAHSVDSGFAAHKNGWVYQ